MRKILLIEKRKKAKKLRARNWSIRKISGYLVASTNSVIKWLNLKDDELLKDRRGWEKGRLRTNTEKAKNGIISIRKELVKEDSSLSGRKLLRIIIKKNMEKIFQNGL